MNQFRYLSVCSGIEAATVAWDPLGWKAAAFAEIEKFPSSVLRHHYPNVPNVGDFTKIKGDEYGAIDLLVGGTPCQDFSVAGLRAGVAGERGNLTLEFLRLAQRMRVKWLVWENVPGVFSSTSHTVTDRDRVRVDGDGERISQRVEADEAHAFYCFLAGLQELGYGVAYRVLDAQYFGVPQRRRRVFVVGHLGDWRRAAAVLFERHSLSGHPAPRREKGQVAPTIPARSTGGGGLGSDFDFDGGLIAKQWPAEVAPALDTSMQKYMGYDNQHVNGGCGWFVPSPTHALRGEGFDASEDGTGRGTPLVPVSVPLTGMTLIDGGSGERGRLDPLNTDLLAFSCKDRGADAGEISPTLRSMGHDGSHANGGGQIAVVIQNATRGQDQNGLGVSEDGTMYTLDQASQHAVACAGMAVRRLTPRECERLQGFPDDYTKISDKTADGPRYKALGNSMAVPVMRWIGERIKEVEAL